ncbi:unnamed protein product [Blepharisma stoltei]|uniref:Uncharacterized protein n=1 Tax=Blepharisma stoltei TaxID=1481888 RepID=A0AAU9JQR1_9CILI|nr:unnamed protein product [Blepharisma stoltei]
MKAVILDFRSESPVQGISSRVETLSVESPMVPTREDYVASKTCLVCLVGIGKPSGEITKLLSSARHPNPGHPTSKRTEAMLSAPSG